jgi:hypothetical protein
VDLAAIGEGNVEAVAQAHQHFGRIVILGRRRHDRQQRQQSALPI